MKIRIRGPLRGPPPRRRRLRRDRDDRSHALSQRRQVPGVARTARPQHRQPGMKRRPPSWRSHYRQLGIKPAGKSYLQAFPVTTDAALGKDNRFQFTENGRTTTLQRRRFRSAEFLRDRSAGRPRGLRGLRHHRAGIQLRRLCRASTSRARSSWCSATSRRKPTPRACSKARPLPSTRSLPPRRPTPNCTAPPA